MPFEQKAEGAVAENETSLDPEVLWGGNKSDWANWETAKPEERDLDIKGYVIEQIKVMLSKETRDAYAADFARRFGSMPMPEPSKDDLANFFLKNGGSIWFKRRFYWRRHDQDLETEIKTYYQNRLWEKETVDHAVYK
jgi:hypothetical protein